MKVNKWTSALASAGVISGALAVQAEETPVMTALSSTTISGYVDTSLQWDLGTGNGYAPAYTFNDGRSDGFNLNAINIQLGKELDEGQWAAGYKLDLMWGPNARNFNPSYLTDGNSDFGIKQAYVELRAPVGNGLDFKVGTFDAIVGYEVAHSVDNPNFSRNWAYGIQPFQHTGVLMSYQFTDMISASAGVANTATTGINTRASYLGGDIGGPLPGVGNPTTGTKPESQKTWMGSVAVTAPESMGWFAGSTLYGAILYGFAGSATSNSGTVGNQNSVNYYVGGTMTTPWEQLSLGAAYDYYGASAKNSQGIASQSFYQNAVAVYASYQATEKMSLHGRAEYTTGDVLYTQADGSAEKILSLTGTVEYELWANVVTRAEFRWDKAKDDQFGGRAPWDGGNGLPDKENAFTAMLNIAYLF